MGHVGQKLRFEFAGHLQIPGAQFQLLPGRFQISVFLSDLNFLLFQVLVLFFQLFIDRLEFFLLLFQLLLGFA